MCIIMRGLPNLSAILSPSHNNLNVLAAFGGVAGSGGATAAIKAVNFSSLPHGELTVLLSSQGDLCRNWETQEQRPFQKALMFKSPFVIISSISICTSSIFVSMLIPLVTGQVDKLMMAMWVASSKPSFSTHSHLELDHSASQYTNISIKQ